MRTRDVGHGPACEPMFARLVVVARGGAVGAVDRRLDHRARVRRADRRVREIGLNVFVPPRRAGLEQEPAAGWMTPAGVPQLAGTVSPPRGAFGRHRATFDRQRTPAHGAVEAGETDLVLVRGLPRQPATDVP